MKKNSCSYSILALAIFSLMMVASTTQAAAAKANKIDINSATQAELESLKGIGASTATKIIAARPFKSIEDLKNVSGIGQATFDGLKDLVTVQAIKAADTAGVGSRKKNRAKKEARKNRAGDKAELIDLNSADKAELDGLPGVGPAMAAKIIAARPFKNIEDLKKIRGFNQKKFNTIKPLVLIGKEKAKGKDGDAKAVKQPAASGPVDLNSADQAALEGLPGIGTALAEKIIAARPFKSIDELKNIKGISQAKFDLLKDQVMLNLEDDEMDVSPKLKPGQTININKAGEEQLTSLLGIGPVKAKAIIAGRPYAKIADIMKVKGIKEKTFAKLKDYIVVR